MTAEELFEKSWATQPYNQLCKPIAKAFYVAGYKNAVGRCVKLARAYEGCDEKILEDIDL